VNEMFEEITGMVVNAFDFVFWPLSILQPHISLLIVSILLSVVVVIINKFSMDKKVVKGMKDKMSGIRENLTRAQKEGKTEEANKYLASMMEANNEYMKYSFKTMIISIVVLSLFLPWMSHKYSALVTALPFSLPFIGSQIGWVGWYILASFAIGWVIRKVVEGE